MDLVLVEHAFPSVLPVIRGLYGAVPLRTASNRKVQLVQNVGLDCAVPLRARQICGKIKTLKFVCLSNHLDFMIGAVLRGTAS